MEKLIEKVFSIVVIKKDYLTLKTHGSFFSSKDLKKSCDIDINQYSRVENLNSFLIELAEHLIKKKKEHPDLIILGIELDSIVDERIEDILKDINKFNFKLEHILEPEKKEYPKLETTISKTLPKDVVERIEMLINNYNKNRKNSSNFIFKLIELFKLHSYLKSIQKLRVQPEEIINNNLFLNGEKIKLDDELLSQITVNVIIDNKPVSNVIFYKTSKKDFYFKFSKLYSSMDDKIIEEIYYYHLLKELKYYIIVGYFKKIFPKNVAYLIPSFKDNILEFKETLTTYSYKLCKYDTLIITDSKNKALYQKKYIKYYNKINRKSKEFIDSIRFNEKLYNYFLENIEIRF
jgi:hypothetical protein